MDTIKLNTVRINSFLKEALANIKENENIYELKQYKKLFKKNIPLMLRSYFAAYLIKENLTSVSSKRYGKSTKPDSNMNKKRERIPLPKIILSEKDSVSLFIGVGRRRAVSTKDILSLIIRDAGIERDRIGEIRILENYSFVQVLTEDADKIIEKLNNSYYHGKRLSVSLSRKKDSLDSSVGGRETYNTNVEPQNTDDNTLTPSEDNSEI